MSSGFIRAAPTTKLVKKGLAELEDTDLLVVGHRKAHIVAIALSVEPFNTGDAWRDFIGSYVVKIRREAGNFSHEVQAWEAYAPFSGRE